ncbi:MAG: SEL1-like repeat protein, partial [Okeania sp. SIO3B3]|nr:SEL1-like repeat protein [Okeania sp. SIO3B3]
AAQAGEAGAMSNLGFAYATGTGVAQDDAQAFQWYERAADQGLIRAQTATALFHAQGRGTPRPIKDLHKIYQ